jgi:PRTRC genetic system protein C
MPIEVQQAPRKFKFNDLVLDDPNPAYTAEEVLDFYSLSYPDLATAKLGEPKIDSDKGELLYVIETKLGTKG